jgi:hypothetical protein
MEGIETPDIASLFAVRITIGLLHFGHIGSPCVELLTFARFGPGAALRPSRRSASRPLPSINSIFRPEANPFASLENVPDVTTYPPATRSAAMTP